ncbi:MAG: DUF4928 family protein [Chloroflexi bacterium]|nr:DUF4928 family protein [Chloroflexota bacterium]
MPRASDSGGFDAAHILGEWLKSCRRGTNISRNTIAIGLVVLHHFRKQVPVSRDEVVSQGGEVKGARSGLGNILEAYGIPRTYLKEVTTRQAHQDAQHLFEAFRWGAPLAALSKEDKDAILDDLVAVLVTEASRWLRRQNLKLPLDRRQAPSTWVQTIVQSAKSRSSGVVEQHLVGAKLERRFKDKQVPNHPAHAADKQTAREGDFSIRALVYHVTATPSRDVIQKCASNLTVGKHPILLVPGEQVYRAIALAQDEGIDAQVSVMSIENFVALNIIELATEEETDFFTVLQEIIEIYNRRLSEVETDLSLQIELH